MTGIYRWKINGTTVNPIYNSDITKDIAQESGQMFFRESINGKLKFLGADYIFINAQVFDTIFVVLCERYYEGSWLTYFTGQFFKTDCAFDIDNSIVEVQIETLDNYNKILLGQDVQYDLIQPTNVINIDGSITQISLNPALTSINLDKRPLIQVYSPNDNVISCFMGGVYWEQPVINPITDLDILTGTGSTGMKFALATAMIQSTLTNTGTYTVDVSGVYIGRVDDILWPSGLYEVVVLIGYDLITHIATSWTYSVVRISDNVTLYVCDTIYDAPVLTGTILFKEVSSGITCVSAAVISYDIYMRYLLALPTTADDSLSKFQTLDIYPLPIEDIVANNNNYKNVCPFAFDCIFINGLMSSIPTQYGKFDATHYFTPPISLIIPKFYPVARSQWVNTSVWFHYSTDEATIEPTGRKQFSTRNNYKISDVIKSLLAVIDPIVHHENSVAYSKFLYDQTGNPVYGDWFETIITPKSNVVKGEYDQPAQKAPILLHDVFNMLANVLKCYWFIEVASGIEGIEDGTKMLRIEHVNFFRHGMKYPTDVDYTSPGYNVDLTLLQDSRNGLSWGFGLNQITFDKQNLSETIQFSWMDKVSKSFEGYPIKIVSNYVTKGKVDTVSVSMFTPDVDFVLTNPSEIAEDGFALFGAIIDGGEYVLPYTNFNMEGINLVIQNGFMSWLYLHTNFYVYDLPASYVYINNAPSPVYGILRAKKHEIKYPYDLDPDPQKLILTSVGNGQIEKISINLTTRKNTVTLKYDTETIES